MARARNIKPSLFKNELLGVADPMLTILFTSLWCLADKAGRLEDRPLRIKAETFPYRENVDINGYLTELSRLGFIYRYIVGDLALIQIINFEKHQNPHHTEKDSVYPKFDENSSTCGLTVNKPLNNSFTPADSLIPDSLIPDSNIVTKKSISDFDVFWKAYPKKVGKDKAIKIWQSKKPRIDDVMFALSWQIESKKWRDGYIPNPTTYLNEGRWKDEPDAEIEGEPF